MMTHSWAACEVKVIWARYDYVEQSLSWEVNCRSASQEIPRLYGSRKFITVFTRTHPSILSQMNLVHNFPSYFPKI
jgi:hypothetical protein